VELDGRARAEEAGESREGYKATQDHLGSHMARKRTRQAEQSRVLCFCAVVLVCAIKVCPCAVYL
jgi:hypothetical protein